MTVADTSRRQRWVFRLGAVVLVLAVFAAGWWAGRTALDPPQDPLPEPGVLSYEVVTGEVSRELNVTAQAAWPSAATLIAGAGGVVTTVDVPTGDLVGEGARILTVNLRPVIVAQGNVPAFRALVQGTIGADVAALQAFLTRIGFDAGTPDGRFDTGTATAVRAWQRSIGLAQTGAVELGDVVFTATLPARVRIAVTVGTSVGPGTALGDLLAPAPEFRIPVTQDQVSLLPPNAEVSIQNAEGSWSATVTGIDPTNPEQPQLILAGPEQGAVCADSCAEVPVSEASTWSASVVIVPRTEGPVIPVAAVRTQPDGSSTVRTTGGEDVTVEVIASNGGLAVVSGIQAGTEIEVPTAGD